MKNIRELFFGFILLFSSSAFAEEGSFSQGISKMVFSMTTQGGSLD